MNRKMIVCTAAAICFLRADPSMAQNRGILAIGAESGRHAFSFSSEADAVNMCGTTDCEVVATFDACLGVAYSRPTLERAANLRIVGQGPPVWSWAEAVEESDARVTALEECQSAGGTTCEILNVYCVDIPADAASQSATSDSGSGTAESRLTSEIPELLRIRLRRLARTLNREIPSSSSEAARRAANRDAETVAASQMAQNRGILAIGAESGRHAFSFSSEADAVNMCGTTDCEVVATFDACLGVAYSRPTLERAANLRIVGQGPPVWSWAEAVEESDARVTALEECQSAGGTTCEVLNVYCVDIPADAASQSARAANRDAETVATSQAERARAEAAQAVEAERARAARTSSIDSRVPQPGEVFRDCAECPEMVVLAGGRLAMGRYEVTVGEYRAFASATGGGGDICYPGDSWRDPGYPQTDRHPVTCVSWDDAQEYVSWLSRTTGTTYRLPTEAEWERAAAGSQPGCYAIRTGTRGSCPVGAYGSNAAGLSDMVGNPWEWTQDCYEGDCGRRVMRGASWANFEAELHPGERGWGRVVDRRPDRGFRVLRTLD